MPFIPPPPVHWTEGQLLMPQHFQQAFLRADQLVAYQAQAVCPWGWGVRRCTFNDAALGTGQAQVMALEAILPDGTVIQHPDGAQDLAVDLDRSDPARRHWLIWLALPLGGSGATDLHRGRVEEQTGVGDLLRGDGACAVARLHPAPRLWCGETMPAAFTGFPLLRVEKTPDGLRADPAFSPPLLLLSAAPPLHQRCRALCTALREVATGMADRAASGTAAFAGGMVRDLRQSIAALSVGLPRLEAMLLHGDPHPYPLFLSLLDLAGRLAGLRETLVPPLFPAYDHAGGLGALRAVLDFIETTLAGLGRSSRALRFHRHEGGFLLAPGAIGQGIMPARLIIAVTCPGGMEEHRVADWVQGSIVCGHSRRHLARGHRLLGLRRQGIERDDALGLESRRGVLLFALESDPGWFTPDDGLLILNRRPDHGGEPEEIVLYLPLEAGRGAADPDWSDAEPYEGHHEVHHEEGILR